MSQNVEIPVPGAQPATPVPAPQPAAPVDAATRAAQVAALAPANVPDKFKNPDGTVNIEKLAQGYRELEAANTRARQGEQSAEPPPKPTEKVDLDAAFKAPIQQSQSDAWRKAQAEIAAEGKVSAETREALRKAHNATDEIIDGMIAGAIAQRESIGRRLAEAAGGVEVMNQAIQFARSKMNEAEQAALRQALEGPTGTLVMQGLVAAMRSANPQPQPQHPAEPQSIMTVSPGVGSGAIQPFSSQAEMLATFRDPRYQTDPKFREWAGQRMQLTQQRR